jgi:hypothetical protein
MQELRLPAREYRAMSAPSGNARVGLFYVPVAKVPAQLKDWRDVNPREVNVRSSTYKAIVETLMEYPERFHERNRGITIVAQEIAFDDKKKEVILKMADKSQHGVVDGSHTLNAILAGQANPPENGWPAYVFVTAKTGIDPEQIAEVAGGLNTSQQVDLKSLENLRENFEDLKQVIAGEPYADKIAYKMNEAKPIDVREVLYYLAVFDAAMYNGNRHPVALFGRKEGIVREFARQAEGTSESNSFSILTTKAPEILRLRDLIEREALALDVGRFKAGKRSRIRSENHRENTLHFIDEQVNGKIPLGWMMPMLAAFRANVNWNVPEGTFSWHVPVEELLGLAIERLVAGILEVHEQENSRPEFVGRNSIAWRMSYTTVSQAILEWQLKKERKRH